MRRKSREVALQILFQTEFAPTVNYQNFLAVFEDSTPYTKEVLDYADQLIKGCLSNKVEIDRHIQSASSHWRIDRMAVVDRNLLRIAIYEMLFAPAPIAPRIAINEAVEIAKSFGAQEASAFVNGILDQIASTTGLKGE